VKGALHAAAQTDQDLVADDLVEGLAQEPDGHEDGQQDGHQDPDVQHVRVHSEHAIGIAAEEPVLHPVLEVMADEALVRGGQRGGKEQEEGGAGGADERGHDSADAYSRARVSAP
jgi:hypothetical protein